MEFDEQLNILKEILMDGLNKVADVIVSLKNFVDGAVIGVCIGILLIIIALLLDEKFDIFNWHEEP